MTSFEDHATLVHFTLAGAGPDDAHAFLSAVARPFHDLAARECPAVLAAAAPSSTDLLALSEEADRDALRSEAGRGQYYVSWKRVVAGTLRVLAFAHADRAGRRSVHERLEDLLLETNATVRDAAIVRHWAQSARAPANGAEVDEIARDSWTAQQSFEVGVARITAHAAPEQREMHLQEAARSWSETFVAELVGVLDQLKDW